jgi:hypothetical protein
MTKKLRYLAIPTALVALLAAISAEARIGETLDECKARYEGPTGQLAPDQFTFRRGHITIIVHVRDGRSIQEDFAPESGAVMSEAEMAGFLQENSEGSTWEFLSETLTYVTYLRKDGRATAQKGKPNTRNGGADGNVKLNIAGAELIIKYTYAALQP